MNTFIEQFRAARRVSTPLVIARTPDPAATIREIIAGEPEARPMLVWDNVRGLLGLNETGKAAAADLLGADAEPAMLTNPVEMLSKATKLPDDSILFFFFFNPQRYLSEPTVTQAIWNLRDPFKKRGRMLVALCPSVTLPAELSQDVLVLDEPLPDLKALSSIVTDTCSDAKMKAPTPELLEKAVDAICGLAAFPAEQVCAMSVRRKDSKSPFELDIESLWERKRQQIEQIPGLSVWRGGETFSEIGGCENIKKFLGRVLAGENQPRAIVFIDEIEKALAGAGGDTSGTSQEMLGALLSFMQDKNSTGNLFIGPPGAAKSAIAKATGNEGQIPTISFDISGMKGSLVGESGANIRNALKLVESVSQGRALFIATCNSIGVLPPELRRRFSFGTFFFDLPTAEERESIWKIYLKRYNLKDGKRPPDEGWTGAEIKQCCDLAWRLKTTLEDAATYIVPVAKSAADQIDKLRTQANGRFISASRPGIYRLTSAADETGGVRRKIATGD